MIEFEIVEQIIEFDVGDDITFDVIEVVQEVVVFEESGAQGPTGERGEQGPPGPIGNLENIDLPDFTLIFDNALV